MRVSLEDVRAGLCLFRDLPGHLRKPFTIEEARRTLGERLAGREARLLDVAAGIYGRPRDPYRALLDHAGCAFGDFRELVGGEGADGALATLAERGVYLRCEEFKGRRPVRRGSLEIEIDPLDFVQAGAAVHGVAKSSGSRGPRTAVPLDLAFVRDHALDTWLGLEAHGGLAWTHAHWGVPGGTSITNPLEFAMGGAAPARWFTPVEPGGAGLAPRYRLASWTLRLGGRVAGVRLPGPTHAGLDDPAPLIQWLRRTLDGGRIPHVWTFASSAVLACRAAADAGIDVAGARFTMGGEPTTAARRRAVEAAGAVALPRYGATETDMLAFACRAPAAPDDMHFLDDRHALVAVPEAGAAGGPGPAGGEGLPAGALLFTSLLASAPILLFNVSLGDVAELDRSPCGCPMEELGWRLRVRNVRSFEKLTAGGIAFLDTEVLCVLEQVLPARFGGGPTDYQVVEEADPSGNPRVTLRVHPALGPLDEAAVADAFLTALGGGDGGERLMELLWREGEVVRVERVPPARTISGKVLHLHV